MRQILVLAALTAAVIHPHAQSTQPRPAQPATAEPMADAPPSRANILRGEYGRYRANNDLLSYHLDVRVDPQKKSIAGRNTVRFRMLKDDTRIQIDLYADLNVDRILLGMTPLKYAREINAVLIDFPSTLKSGREYAIDFYYSGTPRERGRFGGMAFRTDPAGNPWINTACEGEGSSVWWPSKDQWRDEPEEMRISVAIPDDLVDVSNGRFEGKTPLGDGYTRWDWHVQYPINSYDVSLNIGKYVHFDDRYKDMTLDFYVLPGSLDGAKRQFTQARGMLEAFEHYFGEYPFKKDGYKLVHVPYSGMEHQSAVTYGNRFANGYLERDWTGVGISPKFDFIIIHESGHEWFGNAVSAADVSDMWIHEGWTTYLEALYVEYTFGKDDALKYINAYKSKVQNLRPIITQRGIHRSPPQDMYFKAALFLHTLRGVVNDDDKWFRLLRDVYQRFKYQNILTEDLVQFVNARLGQDLTPVFDQYLRRAALPVLDLAFNEREGTLAYRWRADERGFAMPIDVSGGGTSWRLRPTTDWAVVPNTISPSDFHVATDRFYVNVSGAGQKASTTDVFFDDFKGTSLDRTKWNVIVTGRTVNNEQQAYVDSPETISLASDGVAAGAENGALVIRSLYRQGFKTPEGRSFDFVSGRLDTRGKFDFSYGTASARMKLTAGAGIWPAFWALGNGRWPDTGEMDILETVGDPTWTNFALHGPGYSGNTPLTYRQHFKSGGDVTGWHVYSMEWTPDVIVFKVDGQEEYRVTKAQVERYGRWAYDEAKFLIVNQALGGQYPQAVNGVAAPYPGLPQSTVDLIKSGNVVTVVDWVRVTK
jgi:beta-glucanase (GH16 family)